MTDDAPRCPRCYASAGRRRDACPRCKAPLRLHGRYTLLRQLGAGAAGTTWEALDDATQQRVAIKELSFRRLPDLKTLDLFQREVHTLQHLQHPGIPRYLDHFQLDEPRHVALYLVQELIPGHTLPLHGWDEPRVLDLLRQLAHTLDYLASLRPPVVHRDLKPDNIIATPQGRFVLIDFGATRRALLDASHGSTLTGTLGYMAPEQLLGRADPRADLYALGATALALLAAQEPHTLLDPHQPHTWQQRVHASPPLKRLLERLLQPRPEDRLPSPADLLRALDEIEHKSTKNSSKINIKSNKKQQKTATDDTPPRPPDTSRHLPRTTRLPQPLVSLAKQWNRDLSELPIQLWLGTLATLLAVALLAGIAQAAAWILTGQTFAAPDHLVYAAGLTLAALALAAVLALLLFGGAIERAAEGGDPHRLRHLRRLRWGLPRAALIALYDPTGWGILKRIFNAWVALMLFAAASFLGTLLFSALTGDPEAPAQPLKNLDWRALEPALRALIPAYLLGPTLLGWIARRLGALWLDRWDLRAQRTLRRDDEGQRLLRRLQSPPAPRDDLLRLADDLDAWADLRDLDPLERDHLRALAVHLIARGTSLTEPLQKRLQHLAHPRGRHAAQALRAAAWAVRGHGHREEHLALSADLAELARRATR